mmetsp:Transcript_50798/g.159807  ORF Transcript_50798/g.159807 Transcript_50798/m.159807 type:complete len:213 (-) Transcript_50798:540-1178(-)
MYSSRLRVFSGSTPSMAYVSAVMTLVPPTSPIWFTSTKRSRSATSTVHWKHAAAFCVSCNSELETVFTSAWRPDSCSQSWMTSEADQIFGPERVRVWPTVRSLFTAAATMRAQSCESIYAMPGLEPSSPQTFSSSRTLTAYSETNGCMKPLTRKIVYRKLVFARNCSVRYLICISGTRVYLSQSLMLTNMYLWMSILSQHWMNFFLPSQSMS